MFGSPSLGSCECREVAVEETAEGTGEADGGVMCGNPTVCTRRIKGSNRAPVTIVKGIRGQAYSTKAEVANEDTVR